MFNYRWNLSDGYPAKGVEKHNKTVFTTFACGGGSSMGYKLAGYNVIGANDIDPKMAKVYKANHKPEYYFLSDIRALLKEELPKELYDLDMLDGSPPCSTFSMAGQREEGWGKDKVFSEGQSKQILDDLFFYFIDLAKKLRPKIVIAENVKGMLQGNAKGYVIEIKRQFEEAGYNCQIFLLNAATMGVPQKRERVFVLCSRKDLTLPKIVLNFNDKPISFSQISDDKDESSSLTEEQLKYWLQCRPGESHSKYHPTGSRFGYTKVNSYQPIPTLTTKPDSLEHDKYKRSLNLQEWILAGSFPKDYNFLDVNPKYLIGMSVPPVMMAQVAHQVYLQWLKQS